MDVPGDPQFSSVGLDVGYLTTRPGQRGVAFYSNVAVDPDLLAVDESTKEKISGVEITDIIFVGFDTAVSRRINVPVLLTVGSEDAIFCRGLVGTDCSSTQALYDDERPYFGPDAELTAKVIPGVGHNITLSTKATEVHDEMLDWADSVA